MHLSQRLKNLKFRYLAMTLIIITTSLEYSIIYTKYIYALTTIKFIATIIIGWSLFLDTRISTFRIKNFKSNIFIQQFVLLLISFFGYRMTSYIIGVFIQKFKLYNLKYVQEFEVSVQMFLYPFIILILCLNYKGYRTWIKRNSKHLTILLYLYVWIWFGTYYYYIAQRTIGDDFVFSEQARIETTLKGILSKGIYDEYDESRLKNILEKYQYKKDIINLNSDEYLTLDQSDSDWGEIYENMLGREGYSFYSFQISPQSLTIEPSMLEFNSLKSWGSYINKKFVEVKINLYKQEEKLFDSENSVFYFKQSKVLTNNTSLLNKPDKTYTLYFNEDELNNFISVFDKNKIDTHLSHIIASSHTLLDSKFMDISIGLNGYYNYQVEDFWYFSAITITTLGFGDILPNSNTIRNAVMIEALIGVILIGIYISIISSNKSSDNSES